MKRVRQSMSIPLLSILLWFFVPVCSEADYKDPSAQEFNVRFFFSDEFSKTPVNGRIVLCFQKNLSRSVNPDVFEPQPSFALNVRDWKPGEAFVMNDSRAEGWKEALDSLDGWFAVQGLLVINRSVRVLASGVFPAGSIAVTDKSIVHIEKGKMCRPVDLLFRIVPEAPKFRETEFIKEMIVQSDLMTRFYGEPDFIRAAVILPKSYFEEPDRKYPGVYVFGGWGSTYIAGLSQQLKRYGMNGEGKEKIYIFVDHECRSGYHAFCTSETNGPREESFFLELLPAVEKEYRVDKNRGKRFLMGQSSGAWAALWLLINYPDEFGGIYAGSPDPVDFRDFIGTNIYEKEANMFFSAGGELKRFSDSGKGKELTVKDFTGLDRIAGWGEQMYSFDAAFSPRGEDGEPLHLFDWRSGEIDSRVAEYWKKKDLSQVIRKLSGKKVRALSGKIHIYVSDQDDFGLNRPVKLFQQILAKKGVEADIRFFPDTGHNVWTDELRRIIREDMDR